MVFFSGWGLDMCQPWGLAEGKREWAFASPPVVTRKHPHSFPKRHPCTFTQRADLLLYASIWGKGQLPLSPKGWSQCPSSGDPHTGLLRYQRKLRGERYSPSPVCTHTGPSETDLIWPLPFHPSDPFWEVRPGLGLGTGKGGQGEHSSLFPLTRTGPFSNSASCTTLHSLPFSTSSGAN